MQCDHLVIVVCAGVVLRVCQVEPGFGGTLQGGLWSMMTRFGKI